MATNTLKEVRAKNRVLIENNQFLTAHIKFLEGQIDLLEEAIIQIKTATNAGMVLIYNQNEERVKRAIPTV